MGVVAKKPLVRQATGYFLYHTNGADGLSSCRIVHLHQWLRTHRTTIQLRVRIQRIVRLIRANSFIWSCPIACQFKSHHRMFCFIGACGIFTLTIGDLSPWFFMFIAAPATLMAIIMRVPGTNLMLNQQDHDTGSAVALIHLFSMICGSLGMVLVSIRPDSLIETQGFIHHPSAP